MSEFVAIFTNFPEMEKSYIYILFYFSTAQCPYDLTILNILCDLSVDLGTWQVVNCITLRRTNHVVKLGLGNYFFCIIFIC